MNALRLCNGPACSLGSTGPQSTDMRAGTDALPKGSIMGIIRRRRACERPFAGHVTESFRRKRASTPLREEAREHVRRELAWRERHGMDGSRQGRTRIGHRDAPLAGRPRHRQAMLGLHPAPAPFRVARWPAAITDALPRLLDPPTIGSPVCTGSYRMESVMYRYKVDRMGCGGCAKSVTRAIQAVEPNAKVEVDLRAKVVTVSAAPPSGSPGPSPPPATRPSRPEGYVQPTGHPHGSDNVGTAFRPGPEFGILNS